MPVVKNLPAMQETPETWVPSLACAQTVNRLPTMRETWVPSLGREDPLKEDMATHSSIFA